MSKRNRNDETSQVEASPSIPHEAGDVAEVQHPPRWEAIIHADNSIMDRIRIDGGYLYRSRDVIGSADGRRVTAAALAFVPDVPDIAVDEVESAAGPS